MITYPQHVLILLPAHSVCNGSWMARAMEKIELAAVRVSDGSSFDPNAVIARVHCAGGANRDGMILPE